MPIIPTLFRTSTASFPATFPRLKVCPDQLAPWSGTNSVHIGRSHSADRTYCGRIDGLIRVPGLDPAPRFVTQVCDDVPDLVGRQCRSERSHLGSGPTSHD